METYYLNGVDKMSYGIIPGQHLPGSNLAIAGAWDMPARLGKCYHDWGDQDGVEPYVLAEEIRLGGRDIVFTGLVEGNDTNDALRKVYRFYKDIGAFTSTVPLYSPEYGTWNVYVNGQITAQHLFDGWCTIQVPYREPSPDLSGALPAYDPAKNTLFDVYGIDGMSFNNLGVTVLEFDGHLNRPAPKEGESIAYASEGYQITKTSIRELRLRLLISQPTYAAFTSVLKGLYILFKKPGLRYLTYEGDALRDFFVMNGFTVNNVNVYGSEVDGIVDITLTEVYENLDWKILDASNGQPIKTEIGNIIIT